MNFDTRTVRDLIYLDQSLKSDLLNCIDEELIFSSGRDFFDEDEFAEVLKPLFQDYLKNFMKKKLSKMKLNFVRSMIDLNKVDYKYLIDYLTKN
jgi:hypothetical protein